MAERLCKCGCGARTITGAYKPGHHLRRPPNFDRYAVEDRGYLTPCHIWQGSISYRGYGHITMRRPGASPTRLVHRAVYEAAHGPIPKGMQIDHLCNQRACINIDHLRLATPAANVRRRGTMKLDIAAVTAIRASTKPLTEIAAEYGLNADYVSEIRRHKVWTSDIARLESEVVS